MFRTIATAALLCSILLRAADPKPAVPPPPEKPAAASQEQVTAAIADLIEASAILSEQQAQFNLTLTDQQKSISGSLDKGRRIVDSRRERLKNLCDSRGQDVGSSEKKADGVQYMVPGCVDRAAAKTPDPKKADSAVEKKP